MLSTSRRLVLFVACIGLISVSGCYEGPDQWIVDAGADVDAGLNIEADASTQAENPIRGNFRVHSYFEGFADPENGIFEIWMVEPQYSTESRDGNYATTQQPMWCELEVGEDGNVETNPVNTIQLHTETDSTHTTAFGCRSGVEDGDVSTGMNGMVDTYQALGVFCANVTATSFFEDDLGTVVTEIQYHSGLSTQFAHSTATGGNAETTDFGDHEDRPRASYGMWVYGPLPPDGHRTLQWQFKLGSEAAFEFRGRVLALNQEDCDSPGDEDCSGVANDGCFDGADGSDCSGHADCASEVCDFETHTCSETCDPGEFGPDCTPCTSTCGGPSHGWCDDGADGDGSCECESGFHGDSCEFSCSDQEINGDETGIDCGGSCGSFPETCNGRDDDCDRNIDEGMVCGSDFPVTTWDGRGYFLVQAPGNWTDQIDVCTSLGYHGIVIDDSAEDAWAHAFADGGTFWTGGGSNGEDFGWAGTGLEAGYVNWGGMDEPTDPGCILMTEWGFWEVAGCTEEHMIVCESPPGDAWRGSRRRR